MRRLANWLALMVLLATAACAPADDPRSVRLPDLGGAAVDPFDVVGATVFTFVFVRTDCPVANRYAPEIRALAETYRARGVHFWLVYPDPVELPDAIATHRVAYELDTLDVLRDPEHRLVRLAGATVTPEAVVYRRNGTIAYRGRINDRYVDFGRTRPRAIEHDLARALDQTLNGDPVTTPQTKAVGCYISGL